MDIKFTVKRGPDTIEVSINESGLTRIDVQGEVSFSNHGSADEAVRQVERLLGGTADVQKHGHGHHHHHAHDHHHAHQGHDHDHEH
jgi:hypothetical protein